MIRNRSERLANPAIVRLVLAHLSAVIAEWAAIIAVLVHVFDRSGTRATGFASIAMIAAALVASPFTGTLVDRRRPQRVRLVGLIAQVVGYGAAAATAFTDLPAFVTVVAATVALVAVTTLRPSGAVLLPAHVRTSDQLVRGNLWFWRTESFCVLGGPLLATALLIAGGPAAVLCGCAGAAVIAVALTLTDLAIDPPAGSADGDDRDRVSFFAAWRALRKRPGMSSVLTVVWAQYVIIGALDLMLVVIARSSLDLGKSGPGLLSAAFGFGAFATVIIASRVSRRQRLAPALLLAISTAAVGLLVFGLALNVPVALIVLPILGLSRSLLDGPSKLLLQRSSGPEALGSSFAIRELCASSGLITGSVFGLVTLDVWDAKVSLIALGAAMALVAAATVRGLRVADASADVPVVEISLLRRLPMFAPLPPAALEAVARSATAISVEPGEVLVRQGDAGDVFYAVADGSFDIEMSGTYVRTAERLSFFGEVALLADVPRTATVTAKGAGRLLAIHRVDFLTAVTGTDSSRSAAWGVVRSLTLETDVVPGAAMQAASDSTT
ncbi:MAG: cyclic nucleotide-binding domain-containing protein [Ilumatobacteraceae bacterium]